MAILRVRDADGNITDIPAIKGEKGDPGKDGTMSFEDLTDEQKASLKGDKGEKGDTPVKGTDYWTASDKAQIVNDVLNALPTWNGGSY